VKSKIESDGEAHVRSPHHATRVHTTRACTGTLK